jgi:N-acetylmuramoyl-L-alanine amidase
MQQSDWEVALLTLVIWREASDQPVATQQAVGCSIRNRVNKPSWWGTDWTSVICKRLQYSSMTAQGDPNLIRWPIPTDTSWQSCMEVAQSVYDGTLADMTDGATNYYSVSIPAPSWTEAMTFTLQSGANKFYK